MTKAKSKKFVVADRKEKGKRKAHVPPEASFG